MDNKLKKLIYSNRPLFWSVSEKDLSYLSEEAIVETILNYGNLHNFLSLTEIMGLKQFSLIFKKQLSYKRSNYLPQVSNFFNLVFSKYVPEYTE